MPTVREALDRAVQAYQTGRLDEADRLCLLVQDAVPDQPEALRLRGAVALRQGRTGDAVTWLALVADLLPDEPDSHHNLGLALRADARSAEAGDRFAHALGLKPDHAEARAKLIELAFCQAPEMRWRDTLVAPPPRLNRFQIEITTWCNLKCAECSRTVAIAAGRWTNQHMRLEDYRAIIAHTLPGAALVLQGIGEPTLHPNLIEMIAIGRAAGKFPAITFNTNAVGRTVEYYARAQAAGLTHISVSVDSLDQAVANACRFGTKVEKLVRRIGEIRALFPDLVVSIVASRLNLEDLPRTFARLAELGVPTIEIQPLINYQPASTAVADNSLTAADQARLKAIVETVRRAPGAPRVVLAGTLGEAPAGARCMRPFRSPYVTIDGYLTPCCTCFDPAVFGHTSLIALPMEEAWRRPGVRDWLAGYFAAEPAICVGCCFNPAEGRPAAPR